MRTERLLGERIVRMADGKGQIEEGKRVFILNPQSKI